MKSIMSASMYKAGSMALDRLLFDTALVKGDRIDFSVKAEDATKHKRQVTPGDHLRKLKPKTIATMTDAMRKELGFFGYPT